MEDQEVTIIQRITEQWLSGFKCSVKLQRKSYYCGLLSYAKPILSAEQEETILISAQECSSMADTSKFRTPRRNHLKPILVPGETYITEFQNGYQDTVEGGVQCKGVATMRDGSVLDNIITHAVYVVTITQEKFKRIGDQMFTVSSREKLRCTSRGDKGALGCVGSLHTYYWSLPKTECEFKEIRSVTGKIGKSDFLAEDGELYYEITGTQVMPLACGGNTVFQTNVRDIMLAVKKGVDQSSMKLSKPEERLMGALQGLAGYALAELMGPGADTPEAKRLKKRKQLVRYIRGQDDESDGAEYVQK